MTLLEIDLPERKTKKKPAQQRAEQESDEPKRDSSILDDVAKVSDGLVDAAAVAREALETSKDYEELESETKTHSRTIREQTEMIAMLRRRLSEVEGHVSSSRNGVQRIHAAIERLGGGV